MTIDLTQSNDDELNLNEKSSGQLIDLTACGDINSIPNEKLKNILEQNDEIYLRLSSPCRSSDDEMIVEQINDMNNISEDKEINSSNNVYSDLILSNKLVEGNWEVDRCKEIIDLSANSPSSLENLNSNESSDDTNQKLTCNESADENNSDVTVEYNFENSLIDFLNDPREKSIINEYDIVISDDENLYNIPFEKNHISNISSIVENEVNSNPNKSSSSKSSVDLSPNNKYIASDLKPRYTSKDFSCSSNSTHESLKKYEGLEFPHENYNNISSHSTSSSRKILHRSISQNSFDSSHSTKSISNEKNKSYKSLVIIEDDEFDHMVNNIQAAKYKSDDSSDKFEIYCPLNEYIPQHSMKQSISPVMNRLNPSQTLNSPSPKRETIMQSWNNNLQITPPNLFHENMPPSSTSDQTPLKQTPPTANNLILHNGKEYIYKTRSISPNPNYSTMNNEMLQKHLEKNGIKRNTNRKYAITLLEHIYLQTHPIVDDPNTPIPNIVALSCSIPPIVTNVSPISSKQSSPSPSTTQNNKELELKKLRGQFTKIQFSTVDSDILAEDNFIAEMLNEEYIFPNKPRAKIPVCPVPLHLAFSNLFRANSEFRKAVLTYTPFELETLLRYFTLLNMRFERNVSVLMR